MAVLFTGMAALAYVLDPAAGGRWVLVAVCAAVAVILTAIYAARVALVASRGRLRRSAAILLAGLVALEGVLAGGLNVYADTKTAPAVGVIEDYYAEVAYAVSLGDAIHAGQAPAGATYFNVYDRSFAIWEATFITSLNVPEELYPYVDSIHAWANQVSLDAFGAEIKPSAWQSISYTPDPVQVSLSADQADQAFGNSLLQVARLVAAGNRAVATKDVAAMRYTAARLDAQAYWLEAIYSSADPNWVSSSLHFLPLPRRLAAAGRQSDMQLVAARTTPAKAWSSPRSPAPRPSGRSNRRCFSNCWGVRGPVGVLWRSAFTYGYTASPAADPTTWNGAEAQLLPLIGADFNGQSIEGSGSGFDTSQVPPKALSDRCQAAGGVIAGTVWDRTTSRVPTSEPGWTCRTHGGACFDLYTYSGGEYLGGQAGCTEYALVPPQFGPLDGVFRSIGTAVQKAIPSPGPVTPGPVTGANWDGHYNVQYGTMKCSGGGGDSLSIGLTRALTDPVVSGGTLPELEGSGRATIDAGGHASYTWGTGTQEVVTEHFTFTRTANGGASVSGDYDVKIYVGAADINTGTSTVTGQLNAECSGQFSGPRT